MIFTVLGASGFIGRHLTVYLKDRGHSVLTPARDVEDLSVLGDLGHVIYAIGLTGARQEPRAMMEAHVSKLSRLMHNAQFASWLYLSSTRLYSPLKATDTAVEDAPVSVTPSPASLFDISKLAGEALCLSHPNPAVRVARLSNIYGADQSPHTFLSAVMRDIARHGSATIQESPVSGKDYLAIDEAVALMEAISVSGKQRLYNVARGERVTHQALADIFISMGHKVNFKDGGETRIFPHISTERLQSEFGGAKRRLTDDLPLLFQAFAEDDERIRREQA